MPRELLVRYPPSPAHSRILIARGALDRLGFRTRRDTGARRAALVTDARVGRLYGARATASLEAAGISVSRIVVPNREAAKSARQLTRLWDRFAREGLSRRDAVVALGGGAVSDLAGFAAASWLRGVPWICVPTTLLAQVDASVGGKTGVNLTAGKNLAGAFHQPSLVVADVATLATLPARQIRAGLAEVAKMGMATDAALFRWVERHAAALRRGDPRALEGAVRRAVRAKVRVVRRDVFEREGGARTSLNYGHTLGHAIEAAVGYRGILHGEAVAIGMRAAALLSERLAGLPSRARQRQDALLDTLGLPRRMPPASLARLLRAMSRDKKGARGRVRWVLTPRMGHASVPRPIASRLVREIALRFGARA
ncbi:MAG TPA: 3-dehydroquinate synthase [Candidatus Eisenbacteria bacterium]|nr:3-dehydroquinate synthase [Candidatus Eisenbacteria bacterium]